MTYALSILTIIGGLHETVTKLNEELPCKEYQCVLMDLESAKDHLNDLLNDGPSDPFVQLSLEESQKDVWESFPHGEDGPSEGDMLMSAEWNRVD